MLPLKFDIRMFFEWKKDSGKLQVISGKSQNSGKFQNNALNDVKQISLSHVNKLWYLWSLYKNVSFGNFDIKFCLKQTEIFYLESTGHPTTVGIVKHSNRNCLDGLHSKRALGTFIVEMQFNLFRDISHPIACNFNILRSY